jgi:ABC-2 type transport system ATP-binding protein
MSILVEGLTKSYRRQKAIDSISFSIQKGEIVGFLGPNGSGKSTTMKCICGVLPADKGRIEIDGKQIQEHPLEVKKTIGYLPEHNPLHLDMYVREYLAHVDGFYATAQKRSERIEQAIELTGLKKEQNKKIGQLSKGYRQRVGLAQAIIHDPKVLILDEPTTGLDPNQLLEIRKLISGLSKDKTVMLSTHILQEVEAICDRVIVLNQGKLVADGESANLIAGEALQRQTIHLEFSKSVDRDLLQSVAGIHHVKEISSKEFIVEGTSEKDLREIFFQMAAEKNLSLVSLQKKENSLEEVFRKLTEKN